MQRRVIGRFDPLEEPMIAKFQHVNQRFADFQRKALTK
jgi:hypothetical protein